MIVIGLLITLTNANFVHHPYTRKYCLKQSTGICQDGTKYYEELVPLFSSCPTPKWILENRVPWWDGRKLIEYRDYLEHETGIGMVTSQNICKNVRNLEFQFSILFSIFDLYRDLQKPKFVHIAKHGEMFRL